MSKCEFCDIILKSDLDVSKHLVCETHAKNLKLFVDHQPHDKLVQKKVPQNINQVFQALKLRNTKNVRELAEKNYFALSANDEGQPDLIGVAHELITVLFRSYAEYETRNLSPEVRQMVLDSCDPSKSDDQIQSEPQPGPSGTPQTVPPTVRVTPEERTTSQRSVDSPTVGNPSPVPIVIHSSASLTQTTTTQTRPAPLSRIPIAPQNQPRSSSFRSTYQVQPPTPRPTADTRRRPEQADLPNASGITQIVRQSHSCETITHGWPTTPSRPVSEEAQTPAQASSRNVRAATSTAPYQNPGGPTPVTATPRTRPRISHADTPRPRPNTVTQGPRLANPQVRHPMPGLGTPMLGACFMPRPRANDDSPQPRLDSTYRPQLAKVKIEPKDD